MSEKLSSSIGALRSHYEVVVIGSGYGGAISASRLSRAGRQVCVLERGRELSPGQYPSRAKEVREELQVDSPKWHTGKSTGLYDVRLNPEMGVFVGCGLGGTSLVNANVSIRPSPEVFSQDSWPKALHNDPRLEEGFRRAEQMLRPEKAPVNPALAKQHALKIASEAFGAKSFQAVSLNVNFSETGPNHVGVEQSPCVNCGDCITGCNHRAKNTLLMNYLPDAVAHGAEIFCQVQVRYIAKKNDRWQIFFGLNESGRELLTQDEMFITAELVIVAAGTLGSTELLLRSQKMGLSLSTRVGESFSGNGDTLAFSYNGDPIVNGVGFGEHTAKGRAPVGPCITSSIDLRSERPLAKQLLIEEGSIPGAMATFLPEELSAIARFLGQDTDHGMIDSVKEALRRAESFALGAYHGAVQRTLTYLVMGHDGSDGEMFLDEKTDRLRIDWDGVEQRPLFTEIKEALIAATTKLGGTFVPDPLSSKILGQRLMTVHPLGGCAMADDASRGVVNHRGQVFCADGDEVFDSCLVLDGSIVPSSLGVNPLLTISALAERACMLLCEERGWSLDVSFLSQPKVASIAKTPILLCSEQLKGFFGSHDSEDESPKSYHVSEALGEIVGNAMQCTLTVSGDVERALQDHSHALRVFGTAKLPTISRTPLSIIGGSLLLFAKDTLRPNFRKMRYRLPLQSEDGRRYLLSGEKHISAETGPDAWRDCTTMFMNLYEGGDESGPLVGRGVLRTALQDFLHQLSTLQILGVDDDDRKKALAAQFGKTFACELFEIYEKNHKEE